MGWIKRNRKTVIAMALVVGLGAIAAGVYLEWRLAPKTAIRVELEGKQVAMFVYRREADSTKPCRRDIRRLIDRFEGKAFSFEIEFLCSGGKLMVVYVDTYRVSYAKGAITITNLPMSGTESDIFSAGDTNAEELQDVLADQIAGLFGEFRETTREQLVNVEHQSP